MYPMMPQAFVLGEIENLVNTFFERYGKELTFEDRNRFLIYKAVGLFKGKYHVKGKNK